MARMARAEVFSADEVAIVHVMNRVVRRCFLLGTDSVTGKNYDHRKVWIEDLLKQFAAHFGIDLLGFAIMSNHFHLILRSRPDVVASWSDTEVARRWLMLCPVRRDKDRCPEEPNDAELDSIRRVLEKRELIRSRLSDITWWMRLLCQNVAMRANHEDQELGRFWQSRFRAVRLLDEAALVACAAYVDLNPIRAAMAESIEASDFTSAQRRTQELNSARSRPDVARAIESSPQDIVTEAVECSRPCSSQTGDDFLAPVELTPVAANFEELGPVPSTTGFRCSDKGFLPMSLGDYLKLLDWTGRQLHRGKRGRIPASCEAVLKRLNLNRRSWCDLVSEFGKLFIHVAGRPQTIDATLSRVGQHRYHLRSRARTLLAPTK